MEERDLILRCQSRDENAFESLISTYEAKIYNLCFYTLKNREDAMDATQEASIKIYRYINSFRGNSSISTWIYRITYNTCMDYIKKRKINIVSYEEVVNVEDNISSKVEAIVEKKELKDKIKECILKLNSEHRTIILLRDINGLSYQEIADILNIEMGTVKSRISRAREALKNELVKIGIKGGG